MKDEHLNKEEQLNFKTKPMCYYLLDFFNKIFTTNVMDLDGLNSTFLMESTQLIFKSNFIALLNG